MNPDNFINTAIDAIMNTFLDQIESEEVIRPCECVHVNDGGECFQANPFFHNINPIYHDEI